MELEIVRRIRGNVHGTVDVTALEDRVMAHPYVQRLRRIRQLAFLSYVFPGATHSRFEHSLGVMQLAGITWTKMRANQKRLAATCGRYKDFAAIEAKGVAGLVHGLLAPTFPLMDDVFSSQYSLQALRLAGFLHDLGHPAFSHSGERFLPTWVEVIQSVRGKAPPYLVEYLERRAQSVQDSGRDPAKTPVKHEVFTLLLVLRLMEEVSVEAARAKVPGEVLVEARDILCVIAPDLGPTPGSEIARHGVYKLCHELISGEVDIDRMDYLLRDSRECGVVYGIFDATRIQDSLAVYMDPQDKSMHLAINFSGLAAFEDYLRARHSMYLQLYFHKTSVGAEAMIQHLGSMVGFRLPVDPEAYAGVDEYNIEGALLQAGDAIPDADRKAIFKELVSDLLRTRRLWKRVYEVSGKDAVTARPLVERACRILEGLGVPYERVSSSNSLTRFRPRGEGQMSRNYLRLIKKDAYQFPRVVPIEDHSNLIGGNSSVHITRLYVPDRTDEAGQAIPAKVRRALTEMTPE